MARIDFEDDVEAQEEFWALLRLVGADRDVALGKLVRFFRIAQWHWGHDEPIPKQKLLDAGFGLMIQSGWAVPSGDGFHALGAAKHFGWYRQRVQAGKRRSTTERDENGRFQNQPAVVQRSSSGRPAALVAQFVYDTGEPGVETPQKRPAVVQRSSSVAPAVDQPLTLSLTQIQNTENKKNKSCAFACARELEIIYQRFPRKLGKAAGIKRLKAQLKSPEDVEAVLTAVDRFVAYHRKLGTEAEYIPYFSTWTSSWRDWLLEETGAVTQMRPGMDWGKVFGDESK